MPRLLYNLVSGVFGVLLLVAATLEARSLFFRYSISSLVHGNHLGSAALAVSQWSIGLWLLSGIAQVWSRRVAMGLLAVFIVVAGRHWWRGNADCGCFADFVVHPKWTTAFDAFALALIYQLGRSAPRLQSAPGRSLKPLTSLQRIGLAVFVSTSIPAMTLFAIGNPAGNPSGPRVIFLDADSWQGKRCPLFEYVDAAVVGRLDRGRVTIALVDRNCHACQAYLRHRALDRKSMAFYVADISAEADGLPAGLFAPSSSQLFLRPDLAYAADVPVELSLSDGTVIAASRPVE